MRTSPDPKKIEKILGVLKSHPEGIWIRELARQTNLDKSLISRYINTHLQDQVEFPITFPIKLVKLK